MNDPLGRNSGEPPGPCTTDPSPQSRHQLFRRGLHPRGPYPRSTPDRVISTVHTRSPHPTGPHPKPTPERSTSEGHARQDHTRSPHPTGRRKEVPREGDRRPGRTDLRREETPGIYGGVLSTHRGTRGGTPDRVLKGQSPHPTPVRLSVCSPTPSDLQHHRTTGSVDVLPPSVLTLDSGRKKRREGDEESGK